MSQNRLKNPWFLVCAMLAAMFAGVFAGDLEPPGTPAPTMRTLDEISPPAHTLVGFTTATRDGAQGLFTYTLLCQADFPGSRMCTSLEVMNTTTIPDFSSAGATRAWVRPVIVGISANAAQEHVDASGEYTVSGAITLSCDGWDNTGAQGLNVDTIGGFRQDSCADVYSIACCAPPE